MVEINAVMVGVENVRFDIDRYLTRLSVASTGKVIVDRRTAAVDIPSALALVCGYCATPHKTLWKHRVHERPFSLSSFGLGSRAAQSGHGAPYPAITWASSTAPI